MNILFIYTTRDCLTATSPLYSLGDIHIGISYLSGYCKSLGHKTRLVVAGSDTMAASEQLVLSAVSEFSPDIVAFTSVSTQFHFVCALAEKIKLQAPGAFLLVGGAHTSLNPESSIASPFHAICIGEGEHPLGELAAQLEKGLVPSGIPNLWIKGKQGTVEKNAPRDFTQDLDALPFPDRAMWAPWIHESPARFQVVLPSRGCPFSCTYCCNHALKRIAGGKYVRFRSPANILDEIRAIMSEYPKTTDIYLQSETIAVKKVWMDELCDLLAIYNEALPVKIDFTTNFRVAPKAVDASVFAALKKANIRTIEIGLESGSERVRREVLKRNYSNEDFYRAVSLARENGMRVNVYNMIGFPGETLEEHMETVEVNRTICPDRSNTSIFFPYPGTELHEVCKSQGLVSEETAFTSERVVAFLDLPTFSKADIQHSFEWFPYRIYKGHKSLLFRLRKVVAAKVAGHPWLRVRFRALLPAWQIVKKGLLSDLQ